MRIATISLLLLFLRVAITSAAEPDPNASRRINNCFLNGMQYTFSISNSQYAKMRGWNPAENTAPPVTPNRAWDLARTRLAAIKIPANFGWRLKRISLEPVGTDNPQEKWIYVVCFGYVSHGFMTGSWPEMNFIVTMDDELIEPIIDTVKIKKK